jgi:GNAT superfamily N-acetyltransferase
MASLTLRRGSFGCLAAVGPRSSAGVLREQLWFTKRFLGLRADLSELPEPRSALLPLELKPVDGAAFTGFADELREVTGGDHVEALLRQRLHAAGVSTLYVAVHDGRPAYAQWLIRAAEQDAVHAHAPGRYPRLAADEVLLEGAYTFAGFRRLGAMRDCMSQLLRLAAAEGARAALTYVEAHNVPSLRGCADVGFEPDHVRESTRRLGVRTGATRGVEQEDRILWTRAVLR